MSSVVDSMQIAELMHRRAELQNENRNINSLKINLNREVADLTKTGMDLSPDNPQLKDIELYKQKLSSLLEKLDVRLENSRSEQEALQARLNNLKSTLTSKIQEEYGGRS